MGHREDSKAEELALGAPSRHALGPLQSIGGTYIFERSGAIYLSATTDTFSATTQPDNVSAETVHESGYTRRKRGGGHYAREENKARRR